MCITSVLSEENVENNDSSRKFHSVTNGDHEFWQGVSHSRIDKREAKAVPRSILDVLLHDSSDLLLLLQNETAPIVQNENTLQPKVMIGDKDILEKRNNEDVDKF